MPPQVSVCVPVYNGARFLSDCLSSLLTQTFNDLEILIVDDGSTDESYAIAARYAAMDRRVQLVRNPRNLGLVGNWNHCVELAKGEWIKFLFQDDIILPDCVARMLGESRSECDLVAARRELIFADDTTEEVRRTYLDYVFEHDLARHFAKQTFISPEEFSSLMIRIPARNCIGEPSSTMVRKSAFGRLGWFNSELVSLCDWEYFARVAVHTGLIYIDDPLVRFRVHSRARSAELRADGNYVANSLDPLIIQHDMLYLEAYSPLRDVAVREWSAAYLKHKLAEAVRAAHWEAASMPDYRRANAELWRTLRRYPRMLKFPLSYMTNLGLRKLLSALQRGPNEP